MLLFQSNVHSKAQWTQSKVAATLYIHICKPKFAAVLAGAYSAIGKMALLLSYRVIMIPECISKV